MFPDQFFPQLLFFLLAQAAAFGLLRTGMLVWGFSVMVLGWILGDLALILHFGFPSLVTGYSLSLWGLQLLALSSSLLFFGWRILRRGKGFRAAQERDYGRALDLFMAGRDPEARLMFRRLSRRDPWDVEALLFLGRLEPRSRGRAIRRMRLCARLSGVSPMALEAEEEIRRLQCGARREPPAADPEARPGRAVPSKVGAKTKGSSRKAAG